MQKCGTEIRVLTCDGGGPGELFGDAGVLDHHLTHAGVLLLGAGGHHLPLECGEGVWAQGSGDWSKT